MSSHHSRETQSHLKTSNMEYCILLLGQPITAMAHRFAPETPKATKLEFEFMLQQGLGRSSRSCNSLHLVKEKWRLEAMR